MAVVKGQALYKQVASEMRKAIAKGAWKPGEKIPTEDKLTALYGVSRPTVRQAVAELRADGLLDVQQGRGTFVRGPQPEQNATINIQRTVICNGDQYHCPAGWQDAETPTVYRVRLEPSAAATLETDEGEAAFLVQRLYTHESSGVRARYSGLLPMEQITSTVLAQRPEVFNTDAYAALAAAHGPIEWQEAVSARMPNPDERAALHVPENTPLLVSQRVTRTQTDARPLMLETLTMTAAATQLTITHRPVNR
ncbi:GntR family transcriptional regulator [Kitasatospora sp. NPDC058032]|uniref:GntR family transcriptional regulator n=1 Tax=Kitasatospora sp. NPDC058032 TaxID=3346307 RepID=UPI0036D787C0